MKSLWQARKSTPKAVLTILAALVAAVGGLIALSPSPAVQAATIQTCDPHGTVVIDTYVVKNNVLSPDDTQCILVGDTPWHGFYVTQSSAGSVPTDGPPKASPFIFVGCYEGVCSPGTNLPKRLDTIGLTFSGVLFGDVNDATVAAYRLWIDPAPRTSGVDKTEIEAWFEHGSAVRPAGSKVGTVSLVGLSWDVWVGSHGGHHVITFVSSRPIRDWVFDPTQFLKETVNRGLARANWYLTRLQAGLDIWKDGQYTAVDCFWADVTDGAGSTSGGASSTDGFTDGTTDYDYQPYCGPTTTPSGGTTVGGTVAGGTTSGGTTVGGTDVGGTTSGGTTSGGTTSGGTTSGGTTSGGTTSGGTTSGGALL
ncbi:glycosyl hydrolase family 5 [Streptomyces sp. HPF1205]|uniref:GH12 family glycosyl hydrolase domain-containing protein n=1 Tax=Streptomyces sp. HPF1205 TaxID=2873262 RepID=UPI001CED653D|nr:glycosyl hydrolase family 5 [Streptomyces sp. HPF1205]